MIVYYGDQKFDYDMIIVIVSIIASAILILFAILTKINVLSSFVFEIISVIVIFLVLGITLYLFKDYETATEETLKILSISFLIITFIALDL